VLAVVVLAAVLRVYQLGDVPAGFFCDEAGNGYNAYSLLTAGVDENGTRWPLYIWSFDVSYKNPVFIYSAMLPVAVLGLNEFSVRLTAALFGIATVAGLYFLGRLLFGARAALWAALFLAVCPWHIHFSRIGFELISFPCLFVAGFVQLMRFTRGERTLPLAALLLSLCVYAYAIAGLFVPLFALGFLLFYAAPLLRRWRQTLLAGLVAAAILTPAVLFFLHDSRTGTQYFRYTTYLNPRAPWGPQLATFASNYLSFFSPSFLLFEGDPLPRHAVPGFGELHPAFVPFILIGVGVALLRGGRRGWLVLWWLVLYPVGPSLMTEIPSASRSLIGAPAFCLLAGLGIATVLDGVERMLASMRWRRVASAAVAAAVLLAVGRESARYLEAYFVDYPKFSAAGTHGFQYGYRELIQYMESQRGRFDQLMITHTDANQPHIFPLFYDRVDPLRWSRDHWTGYQIVYPDLVSSYSIRPGTLFAVLPSEVALFQDYEIERRIETPSGEVAFVVLAPKSLKRFLDGWLALGPFPNPDNSGVGRDFIDPQDVRRGPYPGAFGNVSWTPVNQITVRVDLNNFYAIAEPATQGNPEWVCAYAATAVFSPDARPAFLELSGSWEDTLDVWLNGRKLTAWNLVFRDAAVRRPIELREGANDLLVKTCESISWWNFSARITDAEGRSMTDLRSAPRLPQPETGGQAASEPVALVEGFTGVVAFHQSDPDYPDYRGSSPGWRASIDGPTEVAWRTAPVTATERTVFAFTASTSDEVADFELSVGERPVLTFQSGPATRSRSWQAGDYRLSLVPRLSVGGSSDVALLSVPTEILTVGAPLELRVRGKEGDPAAWFMIKEYSDTIAHERLTPATAEQAVFFPWEEVSERR
jgi:4-amino-4-deoxy-L-arabinose transferase-like glycosyltransferase